MNASRQRFLPLRHLSLFRARVYQVWKEFEDAMAEEIADLMDYGTLEQEALRGVVRLALLRAAQPEGLPGEHHLYITFKTRAPGVILPPDVVARYPDDMTIVLQHQYWDLSVDTDIFSVMLKFGGMPKVLTVPYAAVTRFADPGVNYELIFDPPEIEAEPVVEMKSEPRPSGDAPTENGPGEGPKVVSLDQFRKK